MRNRINATVRLLSVIILHSIVFSQTLPTTGTDLFYGSGNCSTCHAPGAPNPSALLSPSGNDISPVTYWRATMMANAAKDPFWQAKVRAEVAANPLLKQIIEDKCTTCHAPMGRTEAHYDGLAFYTTEDMLSDPLALDGVSCTVCHQIKDPKLTPNDDFSGHYSITDDRLIYGPYAGPVTGPMQMMSNYLPVHSNHVRDSELCATCHTLFTPYVDNASNIIGEAPEQTPYLEWLNSDYPARGIECQTCHVPSIDDAVTIANRPINLGARSPFGLHEFVGGNVFMLRLFKSFRSELGVTASSSHLDSVIHRTLRQLRQSVDLSVDVWQDRSDTLIVQITIENLTGHKFPTAYPSRRAWLVVSVTNDMGDTLFASGSWNDEFEVIGLDSIYEPHHDVIRQENEVQVYQAIPTDFEGNQTYTLLQISDYAKDNRIPPLGYKISGPAADSTAIRGLAEKDPNFNWLNNSEGSGSDIVSYRISGIDSTESYTVDVKMVYQSMSPRFVSDLFQYDSIPEVQDFQRYYLGVPNTPVIVDSVNVRVNPVAIDTRAQIPSMHQIIQTFPNPFNPSTTISYQVSETLDVTLYVYDLTGQLIAKLKDEIQSPGSYNVLWEGSDGSGYPVSAGVYLCRFTAGSYSETIKMVYLK